MYMYNTMYKHRQTMKQILWYIQLDLVYPTTKTSLDNLIEIKGIHLRNLLTHTLLFWHFLENLNFELKKYFGIH